MLGAGLGYAGSAKGIYRTPVGAGAAHGVDLLAVHLRETQGDLRPPGYLTGSADDAA